MIADIVKLVQRVHTGWTDSNKTISGDCTKTCSGGCANDVPGDVRVFGLLNNHRALNLSYVDRKTDFPYVVIAQPKGCAIRKCNMIFDL